MRELTSYGFCRVGPRRDFFDVFNNDIDGRFKEFFRLVPGGAGAIASDLRCIERHDMTHPFILSFPSFTSQSVSLSRSEPNFTNWDLLLFENVVFNPVSKLSVNAARSCLLSNLEFLNLSGGEKIRRGSKWRKGSQACLLRTFGPWRSRFLHPDRNLTSSSVQRVRLQTRPLHSGSWDSSAFNGDVEFTV